MCLIGLRSTIESSKKTMIETDQYGVSECALPKKGWGYPARRLGVPPGNSRENRQRAESQKKDSLSNERQGLKLSPCFFIILCFSFLRKVFKHYE